MKPVETLKAKVDKIQYDPPMVDTQVISTREAIVRSGRLFSSKTYVSSYREMQLGKLGELNILLWEDSSPSYWLMSLPPDCCRQMCIKMDVLTQTVREFPELMDRWKDKLCVLTAWDKDLRYDLGFVSGSKEFVMQWAPMLGVIPWQSVLPGSTAVISHASVGGVSTYQAFFGIVNFQQNLQLSLTIERVARHVIKFSKRPHLADESPVGHAVSEDSRFSLAWLKTLVHYRTHMSPMG